MKIASPLAPAREVALSGSVRVADRAALTRLQPGCRRQ